MLLRYDVLINAKEAKYSHGQEIWNWSDWRAKTLIKKLVFNQTCAHIHEKPQNTFSWKLKWDWSGMLIALLFCFKFVLHKWHGHERFTYCVHYTLSNWPETKTDVSLWKIVIQKNKNDIRTIATLRCRCVWYNKDT